VTDAHARTAYRVTVRYALRPPRYDVFELQASSLAEALRAAAARIPDEVQASADLVEVRRANPAA